MTYTYTAAGADGKTVTGELSAADKSAAIARLKERNLVPISLTAKNRGNAGNESIWEKELFEGDIYKAKIKKKRIMVMAHQMAIMMRSGVSLSLAMEVLIDGEKDKKFKKILKEIDENLYLGVPISESMGRFAAFSSVVVSLIAVGEVNGRLDEAFESVALILEKEVTLSSKIRGALVYPGFLLFLTLLLLIVMNVMVVPNFKMLFESFHAELPMITQVVMGFSDFIMYQWYYIVGAVVVLWLTYALLKRFSPAFCVGVDAAKFKIPVIGKLLLQSYLARFCRVMSTLVSAGVEIVNSLEISRDVLPNRKLKMHITDIIADVKLGIPIHQSMHKSPLFEPLIVSMFRVGEESGMLSDTISKLAELYESKTDDTTKQLTAMMEPAMTILIAVIVGTVVISIVVPMFGIYSVIG